MNPSPQSYPVPHVVIVGAGFGGLYAARALQHAPVQITILDRHNYHLFQPLLYQVATAGLSPSDIAYPIRGTLSRQKNARVILAEAMEINVNAQKVILRDGEVSYNYLVLATGARHSYFGHSAWEPYAPGLKSVDDAVEIRRRILLAFEMAERETDKVILQRLLTFVIVGAGPTGVELAGAIGEIACKVMAEDFRNINPSHTRVILIEAGPRVLPSFPEDLSTKAEDSLRKLCVEVRKNSPVTSIQPAMVVIGEEQIPAATVIWAAGVEASPIARSLGVPLDRAGRVLVEPDLSVPGHPEIFVIGDLASFTHQAGKPLPGLAPVAIQQGRHAARNILRGSRKLPYKRFHYVHRGALATIGRSAAVPDFGAVRIYGFFAWID
jgi:NADH dehydrogenase